MLYHERPPYLVTESNKNTVSSLIGTPITQIFEVINLPLDWKKLPAKRHLNLIKKNATPLCAAGWFKNTEREKFARYTLALYQDQPAEILTTKSNTQLTQPLPLQKLFTTPEITFLVKGGYSYGPQVDQAILKFNPQKIRTTRENNRMLSMLAKNIADYMFIAPEEADTIINNSDLNPRDFKLIKITDILPGNKRYIICSKKVTEKIIRQLDQAIKNLK